ncbi:MAG: ATP-dependent RecD-like DNA helicase [Candidatus Aminicenantes bacterium]|jgi:exodeoxyribonuclease V alpha subunit
MDHIEGTVESIVYYSPDTGYHICKFLLEDQQTMTIIGNFPPLTPGEVLKIKGKWELNPKFGKQFRVENYVPVLPSSAKGIEKFLSSGLINGIGPVLAKRIVSQFGVETIDILSKDPAKMIEVEGIGSAKLKEIKKSWAEHEDIRELIIFLQDHNITTSLATKIYRQYGDKSFHVLRSNPYQACHDIWGVGFKTADQIALKLGMSPTSPERIKAFISYLLEKDTEQGHVFSTQKDVVNTVKKELEIDADRIADAIESLKRENLIVVEDLATDKALYLPFYHKAQDDVASAIHKLAQFPFMTPKFDVDRAIQDAEKEMGISFSDAQRRAIRESFDKKILVITGGPGTGKTTIIKAVVDIFRHWGRTVLLAAPTGRAAKRLSEATHKEAKTIHRTLEYTPKVGNFRRNESHPLKGDCLVIDEFSMVDLPLMHNLLKAVPPTMRLVLVGDKDQLPSVGPGNLLRDIIDSGKVEVVRLNQIFRQEKDSLIVSNAHRINSGKKLIYPAKGDKDSDFYFIAQEDENKAFSMIMNLCSDNIPKKLGLDPLSPQLQVISPMYRGIIGVDNLNVELQKRLNPGHEGLKIGNREIRLKDKMMQIRNNYDKDVFNGDIGTVVEINKQSYRVAVDFDGRVVPYLREELNEITHAYAISVHKSQGSEYQAVVIPLLTQHYIMLQRNLFYTALTRAKRLSCIVGSYKALYIAIKNDKPIKRNSQLKQKLVAIDYKM